MKLRGEVKAGKLVCNPAEWTIALREYEGKRVVLDIEPEHSIRSIRQNNRYWGVLVPLAGHYLSKTRDVPLSKEQVHFVIASAFLGCDETELGLAPMATRTLTTKQFSEYCDRIELWLAEKGYPVPQPGESVEVA